MADDGESFCLQLNGYFVEQQQGRVLDLKLTYGYIGLLPLFDCPDYRLIQIAVEEVLYAYTAEWVDIFWEMLNRELVRRLLDRFTAISYVRSEMSVRPSDLLPIARTSVVHWSRATLPRLLQSMPSPPLDLGKPVADASWYPSGVEGAFNICAPRVLIPSLEGLHSKMAADPSLAEGTAAATGTVCLSFCPTPALAAKGTFAEMLRLPCYDAFILPKLSPYHEDERWGHQDEWRALSLCPAEGGAVVIGNLSGIVCITQKTATAHDLRKYDPDIATKAHSQGVQMADSFLAAMLDLPKKHSESDDISSLRERFFTEPHPSAPKFVASMLVEERYAHSLTVRGYKSEPVFTDVELVLYLAEGTMEKACATSCTACTHMPHVTSGWGPC